MILVSLCPLVGSAEESGGGQALLEQGIAAYTDLRIEDSLRLLERAERAGGLGDQLARLHLYRGLCRASLGESAAADASFRLALALDGTIELPQDESPVVVTRFEELRQISQNNMGTPDPPPPDEQGPDEPPDEGSTEPPPPPPTPPQEQRPMIMTWVFLGLTGATFLGGTTTLILSQVTRSQARNDPHPQDEADEMLETYRLEARITFAMMAASAALGLTTLIAWLGERRRGSQDASSSSRRSGTRALSILPTLNGLVLSGSWGS